MRNRRFLVIEVCSHVAYMRIGEADNLSRITRIGKDFLVSGQTGIEDDFTAAPRDSSGSAAAEGSTVFKRQYPWPYGCFWQCVLYPASYTSRSCRTFQNKARAREVIFQMLQLTESNRNDLPANTRKLPCHK
jgi:hypothetical protein